MVPENIASPSPLRVTPEHITSLGADEIFVFGSNWAGRHGKGAAKQAVKFGAIHGKGVGLVGNTYGIATKDRDLRVLTLAEIRCGVERFLRVAERMPKNTFLVTPIGCGLAGYHPKDIAPMFSEVRMKNLRNVVLPQSFWNVLEPS